MELFRDLRDPQTGEEGRIKGVRRGQEGTGAAGTSRTMCAITVSRQATGLQIAPPKGADTRSLSLDDRIFVVTIVHLVSSSDFLLVFCL